MWSLCPCQGPPLHWSRVSPGCSLGAASPAGRGELSDHDGALQGPAVCLSPHIHALFLTSHKHSWRPHCSSAALGTGNIPVLAEITGQGLRQPAAVQRALILELGKPEPDPSTASGLAGFQTCLSLSFFIC